MGAKSWGGLLIAGLLLGSCAGVGPFKGNDTGGIIAYSPQVAPLALDMAMEHCARYRKHARITSVRPLYGDYIAFACQFSGERDALVQAAY